MQPLTGDPRGDLTADQVRNLLTGDQVAVTAGLDLLDDHNQLVADISDDLVTGTIEHDLYATVHRSCDLQITRTLVWGRDRVRPHMTLTVGDVSARFNLGVYVLTTPLDRRGQDPVTYDVHGYDLLHLLQGTGPADTYVVDLGTTYLQAIHDVVAASGVGATVLLDGTLQDTPIPSTLVWALRSEAPTWLTIANDLLAAIGYDPIWADENGNLRSSPYRDPATRAVEWTFDTSDPATNLVGEDRTLSVDVWRAPNWWRFIRTQMDVTPIEGDGIHTIVNQNDGPASIDVLGREVRRVEYVDAADQAALVAQATRRVAEDRAAARTFELSVEPLPVLAHGDVVQLVDAGETDKAQITRWTLPLDGSQGALTLGGPAPAPAERVEEQARATVTSDAPLRVVVDGATVDSMANALDAAIYEVGDRVTVTVRNPTPPLVQGVETTGGA